MIREVWRGFNIDTDVPEGVVQTERWDEREVDLFVGPRTAAHLIGAGLVGVIKDRFGHEGGRSYEIPAVYLADPEDVRDLVSGLRLVEPDAFAQYCQYGPCILRSARVAGGYSLCAVHGDALVDAAALWARRRWSAEELDADRVLVAGSSGDPGAGGAGGAGAGEVGGFLEALQEGLGL